MRVFLIACLAIFVLAFGALYTLNSLQKPAGATYTTEAARIDPRWSLRQVFSEPKAASSSVAMGKPQSEGTADDCGVSSAWTLILADFRNTPTAEPVCRH